MGRYDLQDRQTDLFLRRTPALPKLKIGVQLRSLRMPLREALVFASKIGAQAVEIDARTELRPAEFTQTARRQFRKLLADMNLGVAAVSFYTRRSYHDSEQLEARVDATKRAMEMAFQLGAGVVINQVGQVPEATDDPRWTTLVDVLSDLGRYGQRTGALLAAETGSESGLDLRRLLDALPPASVGVNLDPGSLIMAGHSPIEAVEVLGSSILHVHAKDGVRDRSRGRGTEVLLGRGQVDFAELLGALDERGYRGYFTVAREQSPDPQFEIQQAVKFLGSL